MSTVAQSRDVSLSLLPAGVLVGLYLPLLLMFMLSENGDVSLTRHSIYVLPVALMAVVAAGGRVSLDSRCTLQDNLDGTHGASPGQLPDARQTNEYGSSVLQHHVPERVVPSFCA